MRRKLAFHAVITNLCAMRTPLLATVLLCGLTACGGSNVRETLGLNRAAPDEFKVVSRPPLSVPPEFFLEPPRPGEPPRESEKARDKAASLLLKDEELSLRLHDEDSEDAMLSLDDFQLSSVPTATDPVLSTGDMGSVSESRFLDRFGAEDADENIRIKLIEDRQQVEEEGDSTTGSVQRWLGLDSGDDPLVAPQKEAERIREKQEKGETVSGEDAEVSDPKKRSVIDQIFN
jgi:hypothetical protein